MKYIGGPLDGQDSTDPGDEGAQIWRYAYHTDPDGPPWHPAPDIEHDRECTDRLCRNPNHGVRVDHYRSDGTNWIYVDSELR